ncbi:MoaD/ThiS family protein [Fulvivirgaceae bacterium BMA10]|uniref:Molybdopterin synthase sulfur carrier subunit n=1 Tax=Splendidivirga corallicola TaxID=3051826 RepID=A0ABT8KZL4_9BACT|nr:MoaD/ThiS family protein [Fulvivirgaceae bacterium BMA10]
MKLNIVLFGIAKDIAGTSRIDMEVEEKATIANFKTKLINRFPEMEKLASLAFAVDTEYVNDDYVLRENEEVVIIPPVSGG